METWKAEFLLDRKMDILKATSTQEAFSLINQYYYKIILLESNIPTTCFLKMAFPLLPGRMNFIYTRNTFHTFFKLMTA